MRVEVDRADAYRRVETVLDSGKSAWVAYELCTRETALESVNPITS